MHVDVRLPRTRLDRLRSVVGYATVEAAETLEEPDPDWVRLRLELSWPEEVPGHMLAMGSSIEVLAPIEVRERVVASARRIVERYGRDEPVTGRLPGPDPMEPEAAGPEVAGVETPSVTA
jgi:predicted DNA-binding transcriptional regulator YafY